MKITQETIKVIPVYNHDAILMELYYDKNKDVVYKPNELEFNSECYENFIWGSYLPKECINT